MKAIGLINIYGMVICVKTCSISGSKVGVDYPTLQIRDYINIPANYVIYF